MVEDDSFTTPGAIPFSWEIKPGVPKIQHHHEKPSPPPLQPPSSPFIRHVTPPSSPFSFPVLPSPPPPQKLKPPPPCSPFNNLVSPEPPRTRSFRWTLHARSERWRFDPPLRVRPECVSPGCFPSPLTKLKKSKKRGPKPGPRSEPDYGSRVETMSPWSVSSRRSVSPLWDSPKSSFSSSFRSTPRYTGDAEWAGFGLF